MKVLKVLFTVALAMGVPYLAAFCASLAHRWFGAPAGDGPLLPWLYSQHAFQLIIALIAIAVLRRFVPADYGLHLPKERSYFWPALLWGAFFGVAMTLVDYAPELISSGVPQLDYPLTTPNVTGWLFFECVYVGPTEEIPFRSLLVTYLSAAVPGRVKLGRYELGWAGVFVALLFALLHASNFWSRPCPLALGQQIYAFVMGVFYAYWLEKSRSVVAPIVGHNASDGVEYLLLFGWIWLSHR